MNAEYLLDAIGRLDDDLVQEAERCRRSKFRYGQLLCLAASFAVVLLLGYGATHIGGMGGGAAPTPGFSGGGNGGAPASGNAAPPGDYSGTGSPSASIGGDSGEDFDQMAPQESAPSGEGSSVGSQHVSSGTIFVRAGQDSGTYLLTGEVLEELPEGGKPVLLGRLLALGPDSSPLCTTVEEYVGLNLWAENDGADILCAVYVELPEGGFARAELAEP